MTLDQRLQYCRICENRKMNPAVGLVCGLTNEKPAFEGTCPTLRIDQPEATRLVQLERAATAEEAQSGAFATEKKGINAGVLGGFGMCAVALVWFFVGLSAGYIFYYPPVLFIIGVVAIVRGALK